MELGLTKKNKSELFSMGREKNRAKKLANILRFKLGSFPIKYLGLLLFNKTLMKNE